MHAPLIDGDRLAPASARRFGPRLMELSDYYMRLPGAGDDKPNPFRHARARQRLLQAWHRFEPLFYRGRYTVRGNAKLRVGTRLVHEGRRMKRE